MTAPTHWGWWYAGNYRVLHFVKQAESMPWYEKMRDHGGAVVRAACGYRARFEPAGVFSRMSARRCDKCCDRTGIARGVGTPRNEASRGKERHADG